VIQHHLKNLQVDLQERHAADVDDICFSLGAAAVFTGSFVASPPGTKARNQSFALLMVLGAAYIFLVCLWLVQWVVAAFKGLRKKIY
jgi:hypothetical protein